MISVRQVSLLLALCTLLLFFSITYSHRHGSCNGRCRHGRRRHGRRAHRRAHSHGHHHAHAHAHAHAHHGHGLHHREGGLTFVARRASSSLKHNLQPLHNLTTGKAAITASLLTSSVSFLSVILLPFASILSSFLMPFSAGALLSDLVYHLLPHMYTSSTPPSPTALLISVFVFALLDAFLRRVANQSHDHSHGHAADIKKEQEDQSTVPSLTSEGQDENKAGVDKNENKQIETEIQHNDSEVRPLTTTETTDSPKQKIATNAYINLAADALHNFCDGLALAAAFTASTTAGIATTIAIILHELPQEMADFTLLVKSGMSNRLALFANVTCSLTALLGTIIGLKLSDVDTGHVMPVAAGALLYMTFCCVIPDVVNDVVKVEEKGLTKFVGRAVFAFFAACAGVAVVAAVETVHEH